MYVGPESRRDAGLAAQADASAHDMLLHPAPSLCQLPAHALHTAPEPARQAGRAPVPTAVCAEVMAPCLAATAPSRVLWGACGRGGARA